MQPVAVFNPEPRIERIALDNGASVYVIDDALLQPERYVEWAAVNADAFRPVDFNAYPGTYLLLPDPIDEALRDYFNGHMRRLFDARRLEQMHCRLSMVTLAPEALRPYQWLCHSDRHDLAPGLSIQASVLYLFKEACFGGTSFYVPTRGADETRQLFKDAAELSPDAFTRRYGLEPGYMHASNAYFRCVGDIPPRFNRLIFYDGSLLHSGSIARPEKLVDDPRRGRLTFNGFFICRRNAA